MQKTEGKKQYHVGVSNRFAAFENLDAKVESNGAWETRKQTKLQWLQHPSEMNANNLNT
jgi:hypothetical protein